MNSEEKFKKQLEDKLRSKEFSFDDANWHSMREMIDESRNKKKRRVLVLLFLLVGILASISFYLFTYSEAPAQLAINHPTAKKPSFKKQMQVSDNSTTTVQAIKDAEVAGIKENTKNSSTRVTEETPLKRTSPELQSEREAVKKSNTAQPKQAVEKTKQEKHAHPIMASNKKTPPMAIVAGQTQVSKTKDANAAPEINKTPDLAPQAEVAKAKNPAQESAPSPASLETHNHDDKGNKKDVEQNPAVAVEEKTSASDPQGTDSLLTTTVAAALEEKKDSAIIPTVAKILHPDSPAYAKHILWLEAGTNYMAGWKVNDKRDGNGLNFVAGINYLHFVTRKVGVSAGIHYTSVRNLSAFSHTSTVTKYGFGEKTEVTVITPEKIHYLQLPLKIQVRINDKNFFGAGYTLGYLLTVNSKTEKRTDGFNYATATTTGKTRGYTEGFSAYDSQLSLFYRRMIYKKLFINAEMMLGLTDTRKNSFFVSNTAERNMGLKLTLMYNIFQK